MTLFELIGHPLFLFSIFFEFSIFGYERFQNPVIIVEGTFKKFKASVKIIEVYGCISGKVLPVYQVINPVPFHGILQDVCY